MAQSVEITTSYGYQFGSKLSYGPNYLKIDDSGQWGVTIGFETFDDTMIEISYTHQGTTLNIRDVVLSPSEGRLADVSGDWIMLGGTRYFPNGKIRPFAGGALGIVILSPSNENRNIINGSFSNETKFAFSFKAGVNFMFSETIGLNLQGNLMFPVNWGGVYVGGGSGGISAGAGFSSTTLIGGFSGGLVFKIK
ncbi:hypothetical protein A9Q87_01490 [Flavobacteriales bacterium 34_180_T64]|nr:hypothetical protein A9Q87_01490 [Flavobacteriales bacterium 34_180_T64]